MPSILKVLRSSLSRQRPTGRSAGELYVNQADNMIGFIDTTGAARDLLAVTTFSTTATYAAGDLIVNGGQLLRASAAIPAGAFDATQWGEVGGLFPPRATITAATTTRFVLDGTAYTCQLNANITDWRAFPPTGGDESKFAYDCRIDFTPPAAGTFTATIPTWWRQAGPLDAISLSNTDVGILCILSTEADGTIVYTAQELT
jgi:hypothetical protein